MEHRAALVPDVPAFVHYLGGIEFGAKFEAGVGHSGWTGWGCLGGKNGLLHPGRVGSRSFSSSQLNWTGASPTAVGASLDAEGASVDAVGCSEAVGASPESPEP